MTDSAKLDLLLSEMQEMKRDIHLLKEDTRELKEDVKTLKEDVRILKDDVQILKDDVQVLKDDVQVLKDDVQTLKENVQTLNETTQSLDRRVSILEGKLIHVELVLENEIRVSIKRVAEGHLDLSRNLHEAIKPSSEMEMLSIRVLILETDVTELKSRFACH